MLHVLHLFWQPDESAAFIQDGHFYLWLESPRHSSANHPEYHPGHLRTEKLAEWLGQIAGLTVASGDIVPHVLALPSDDDGPLPSPEWLLLNGEEYPEQSAWKNWKITCYRLPHKSIQFINDLHFRLILEGGDTRAGSDFLFWLHFTQSLKNLLLKDHYIPTLRYRTLKGKGKKQEHELYAGWEFVPGAFDSLLMEAMTWMPPAAAPGVEAESALRHAADVMLNAIAGNTPIPSSLLTKLADSFIYPACFSGTRPLWKTTQDLALCQQWQQWRHPLVGTVDEARFVLGLQLQEAPIDQSDEWFLSFRAIARHDPSLQVSLKDYWDLKGPIREVFLKDFGEDFEQKLLYALGQAARIYPLLWEGMQTAQPVGLKLTLEEAFEFLNESAWILEDAGFQVSLPFWWTPQGRRRAKIRVRSAGMVKKVAQASRKKSYLNLEELSAYRYDLILDGEDVSPEEWAALVAAKTPLVQFRGQWVALDREHMQEMLDFWRSQSEEGENLSVHELLRRTAEEPDGFEIDPSHSLASMLAKLRDPGCIEPIEDPQGLNASLRDYQKRGVAWLVFLEQLGLAGCLADDMGLGKTIQVIARLLLEQAIGEPTAPTLLIAPTSVLGNWQKEIERFAPSISPLIHHGAQRCKDQAEFRARLPGIQVVLVSYTLALRDQKLLGSVGWRRIVLDEAQNIKNPEAKQTKAILTLKADYRLALTGTPVENRLLDLWSIFNFLNPGYLGRQTSFRKQYETPIQRDHDPGKSLLLKRLTEPFILRRVKTDPGIVKDLPDKVENRQFCNLSREQASLYEAVALDVAKQLEEKEGIERQGLILSTLMKLKQICNHPAQFLHDGSPFDTQRSHKLERLVDMLRDVLAAGESALIFTQFTEIGSQLARRLEIDLHATVYYLHGGTSRIRREQMISHFQNPDGPPALFILSLKAGGVGITLTRANHVFHFDRWWNPAVEDQATDRAFRIGQTRNVFVHKFITLGTLEERIDQMIEDKRKVAGSIVGNDESWLSQLDNEAFKRLIALNRAYILED